jgi:DNA-binding NarL/FixJ family response regulator
MFAASWHSADPFAPMSDVSQRLRTQPVRSILASLGEGVKDEVAARKLGLSVRTYRRHVAEIMRDMRATSRFQAGVRAAELGLL